MDRHETTGLQIKIWGGRGSLPSPLTPASLEKRIRDTLDEFQKWQAQSPNSTDMEKFLRFLPRQEFGGFGGDTLCVEVTSGSQQLIIDGGTGIRLLGDEIMKGPCAQGKGEAHILFTHFHWDHLIGLPFFTPFFIPGNKIHVYAVQPNLKEVFSDLFKKPYFPVPLDKLSAEIIYHQLEPRKPMLIGDISVTPYSLDHPDACWGYKIENEGRVFSHCIDTECVRVTRDQLGLDLPLYQGVDLMLFDAQYNLQESKNKVDWGHSSAIPGLDIAMREGIKKIVFLHHDPASSDDKVRQLEHEAQRYYEAQIKLSQENQSSLAEVEWSFGHDGLVLSV